MDSIKNNNKTAEWINQQDKQSQPSVPWGSTFSDSTNHEWEIFRKITASGTEPFFFLVLFPKQRSSPLHLTKHCKQCRADVSICQPVVGYMLILHNFTSRTLASTVFSIYGARNGVGWGMGCGPRGNSPRFLGRFRGKFHYGITI